MDQECKDDKFRVEPQLDDALQRELEDALGGKSLDELIDEQDKAKQAAKPATAPGGAALKKGRVTAIHGDDIFVDMGGKSQGVLPRTQFTADEPEPRIGDMVEFTIEGLTEDGMLQLNREGAVLAAAWETLEEGQTVEGRVTGMNKGGLELTINGIRAFMPISQVDMYRTEDLTPFLNQKLLCQVSEVNREEKNVVVSRRALLEFEAQEAREKAFASLVEGQTITGTVRSIMPYGAFVTIMPGVDGLLHVKDMSHGRVEDPKSVVKEGQRLELMILKVDRESRKIGLGLKQIMADPWTDIESKYVAEQLATGRVTRLAEFGAFVELEPGVEGLVPMGEMSFERRVHSAADVCKVGDVIKVRVLSVDPARKRISLSIKRVGDDPWMGASTRWPVDSSVTGVVKRLAEFGAFVEITAGVEGLVHISEISHERIRTVGDALQVGQTVQAKVLEVDEDRRRIGLSIRQLLEAAERAAVEAMPSTPAAEDPAKPQPKRKKPLKGGLE